MATEDIIEEHIGLAKYAEQAERYADMAFEMKRIVTMDSAPLLNAESRNLLSVAYKNIIGARRSAWRIINAIEMRSEEGSSVRTGATKYRKEIELELFDLCKDVLTLLDNHLLPKTESDVTSSKMEKAESMVFYYKMKGDYFRYIAEVADDETRIDQAKKAMEAYQLAMENTKEHLSATHPITLGLALNFSVFYYEIMGEPAKACALARSAFDNAVQDLDSFPDCSAKDSTLIMQLIKDNLTLWTAEGEELEGKVEDIEDQ